MVQENTNGRNKPSGQIRYDRPGRPLHNLDAGKLPRWNLIICFPIEGLLGKEPSTGESFRAHFLLSITRKRQLNAQIRRNQYHAIPTKVFSSSVCLASFWIIIASAFPQVHTKSIIMICIPSENYTGFDNSSTDKHIDSIRIMNRIGSLFG